MEELPEINYTIQFFKRVWNEIEKTYFWNWDRLLFKYTLKYKVVTLIYILFLKSRFDSDYSFFWFPC